MMTMLLHNVPIEGGYLARAFKLLAENASMPHVTIPTDLKGKFTKNDNRSDHFFALVATLKERAAISVFSAPSHDSNSIYWMYDQATSDAVLLMCKQEIRRQAVLPVKVYSSTRKFIVGRTTVVEIYECALPDGKKVRFQKIVEAEAVSPLAAGDVSREPVLASFNADALTVRLQVRRSFTRADGTIGTTEEITLDLPVTIEFEGYVHFDWNHTSTLTRRYTVTHEGTKVTAYNAGNVVHHNVILSVPDGAPVLDEESGSSVLAHFTAIDTHRRPDGSTYTSTERSYTEHWPITEHTNTRVLNVHERITHHGHRNPFHFGPVPRVLTTFMQMGVFQRRIAIRPDGTEHVIRDWWQVSSFEQAGPNRTVYAINH